MRGIEDFCCQNIECADAGKRGFGNVYFRGWSGKGKRIRMVYCRTCKRSFSERKATPLERSRLPRDKVVSILEHLREGCGTRATGRLAPRKPGPGRPPKPLRVMPPGLCYATACKRREKGKVVEVVRKLVFGTALLPGALLALSCVSRT